MRARNHLRTLLAGAAAAAVLAAAAAPHRSRPAQADERYAAAEPSDALPRSAGDRTPVLPDTLRLERYVAKLRQIRVVVHAPDGSEVAPPPFLFDTGGGFTLLTPPTAASIGCVPYGGMTGFRHDGERVTSPECGVVRLLVDGQPRAVMAGVFDLDRVLPAELPKLGGVLSLHTFRGERVTLDLSRNELVLESETSFAARTRTMRALHARLETEAGGEGIDLFVEVGAKTGTLWLLADSGNLAGTLLAPHALRQLGYDGWADAAERDSLPGEPREITLDLLGFGPVAVNAIAKPSLIHDGLLDVHTLERLVLAMDLAAGRAWAAAAD